MHHQDRAWKEERDDVCGNLDCLECRSALSIDDIRPEKGEAYAEKKECYRQLVPYGVHPISSPRLALSATKKNGGLLLRGHLA